MVKVIMDVSALKDQKKGIVLQSTVHNALSLFLPIDRFTFHTKVVMLRCCCSYSHCRHDDCENPGHAGQHNGTAVQRRVVH